MFVMSRRPLMSLDDMVVCWSLTSLCHSNGHIETMPARDLMFVMPRRPLMSLDDMDYQFYVSLLAFIQ